MSQRGLGAVATRVFFGIRITGFYQNKIQAVDSGRTGGRADGGAGRGCVGFTSLRGAQGQDRVQVRAGGQTAIRVSTASPERTGMRQTGLRSDVWPRVEVWTFLLSKGFVEALPELGLDGSQLHNTDVVGAANPGGAGRDSTARGSGWA